MRRTQVDLTEGQPACLDQRARRTADQRLEDLPR